MKELSKNIKENNRDYVYRILKENIMYLKLKPGQNIGEVELSEKLGVSRTPIREALVKLADETLVEVFPQKGTQVSKIDLLAVEEAFHIRKLIEKDILKKALEDFEDSSLKELEKLIYLQKGNIELNGKTEEFFAMDNQFHKCIYDRVGRQRTWIGLNYISIHYDRLRFLDADAGMNKEKIINQHIAIYEAIKNKDYEKLKNIIEEHLANFKDKLDFFKKIHPEYFNE